MAMPGSTRASGGPPRTRLCGLLLWVTALPVGAIDITVDVLGDPVPNGCTPGDCSLREAVTLANSLAGPDRILLPATPGVPLQLSIPGDGENANATGDLDITDDLEIVGTGAATTVLVQTAADRVLQTIMPNNKRLTLRGLTIQGGRSVQGGAVISYSLLTVEDVAFVGNLASYEGGAIHYTGQYAPAITEPRLVLRRVRFANNVATQASQAYGGALHATSFFHGTPFVVVEDCDFEGNESKSGGGAVYLSGSINWAGGDVLMRGNRFDGNRSGGIGGAAMVVTSSSFTLRIEDSLFEANVSTGSEDGMAGAVYLDRAHASTVLRTTFADNSGNRGGALRSNGAMQLIDSLLTGNTAARAGGAVWAHSNLLVDRSTFASNRVTSTSADDDGGGAIGYAGFSSGTLGIQRSTFSNNDAFRGGAVALVSGRLQLYGSTLVAASFGIAGRTGTALRILDETPGHPLGIANSILSGTCTFASAGRQLAVAYNNIEAPGNSCRFNAAVASSQNQVSATTAQIDLGPLADNGGPTPTRLPGAASIAVNQGRESHCTASDQRRYARPDAQCDIGAVEVGATPDLLFDDGFD